MSSLIKDKQKNLFDVSNSHTVIVYLANIK